MRVCRFVMVKPAQLNSHLAAALGGSGVLSLTKSPFKCKTLTLSATVTLQLHTCMWRDHGQPSRSAWYSQSIMHAYLIRCGCGGTDEST